MKHLLLVVIFLPLALFAQSQLESPFGNLPSVSKKESAILKEAFADNSRTQKILEEAIADGRDNPAITFNLGNCLHRNAQYRNAAEAYEKALLKLPNFFAARKNLAYTCDMLGQTERARENFAKALALSGNSDVDILLWLASYSSKKSDWSSALACVEQALLHAPQRRDAKFAKALYLFNIGRFGESEAICSSLLKEKFPDGKILRLLGKNRAKLGDTAGAIAAFSMIDSLDPEYKNIRLLCADILFSEKAFSEASKIYLLYGDNSKTIRAANALSATGRYKESSDLLSKLPASYEKNKILAFCKLGLGNSKEAKKLLLECLNGNPYDPKVCFVLAKILLDEGDCNYAKILYKRAQNDKQYNLASQFSLMSIAVKEGSIDEAISLATALYAKTQKPELDDYIKYLKDAKKRTIQ